MTAATRYVPQYSMFLWYLGAPAQPVPVGTLRLVRSLRGVSLQYDASWLRGGFALSEDLPLIDTEFLPAERDSAAGAVDDARPDRWGERVIRVIHKPERLSLLEYLYFAGDERFGALGVSLSARGYLPHLAGALPTLADAQAIQNLVRRVLANEPVAAAQRRLIAPGGTMGGARRRGSAADARAVPCFIWLRRSTMYRPSHSTRIRFQKTAPSQPPAPSSVAMEIISPTGSRRAVQIGRSGGCVSSPRVKTCRMSSNG